MRKPDFYLCENKGADQLRSNCEADQRLCFRYTDNPIPLLYTKFQASDLLLTVQASFGNPEDLFSRIAAHLL